MAAEMRGVPLTVAEANCLVGILKGYRLSHGPVSASIGTCYAEADQAFRLARAAAGHALAGKWWSVDEYALLAKLQVLGLM